MLLSINELFELTGRDRKTIKQKLEDLTFVAGAKSAHLYESREALPKIYAIDNLEAALNAFREEDLRKQRIPIQIARDVLDEVCQSIGATLKAAKNKKLTPER